MFLVGVGTGDAGAGTNFGLLEYWVRLKVPMEQALRLFKVPIRFFHVVCFTFCTIPSLKLFAIVQERTKALGYIDSNARATEQALQAMDENAARRPPDNVNQVRHLSLCHNINLSNNM